MRTNLGPTDWAVLGLYFVLIALCGWWFSRRRGTGTQDYFLGGRTMPVWAVAISVVATSLSAATFIGVPEMAYKGDLTYLSTNIGSLIAVGIVAAFFIPAFYRTNVTSIYELLEHRLGRGAKVAASVAFMGGRVLASGARLYIAAIPISLIIFGDSGAMIPPVQLFAAIAIVSTVAVVYTLTGGIASVIWTEVIQTMVLLAAVIAAILILLHRIDAPLSEIAGALEHPATAGPSKLRVFATDAPLGNAYSLPAVVIGFAMFGVAAYGTDHDLAQRMLTCKNAFRGGLSAVVSILLSAPIVGLFLVIGLLLYVFYQRPDLVGAWAPEAPPTDTRQVFLTFILREMPRGMSGLMIAGLFSVGVSSLASALNAMAAAFLKDVYVHVRPGRGEAEHLRVGKLAVVGWGVVLALFACLCVLWNRANNQGLIDFALSVMTFAYAGLLGVFATAIFTRRGNTVSAVAAIVVGAAVVVALQPGLQGVWMGRLFGEPGTAGPGAIAWPWHLVLAAPMAFGVCCLGRRPVPAAVA